MAFPKDRILLKSGGFSSQLAKHVNENIDGHPLWGSRFDYTNPDAVEETHLDFLRTGADIILTNTYQSSIAGYQQHLGLSFDESKDLIAKSVRLADNARKTYLAERKEASTQLNIPLIFASIGPYAAHLHDGSEYVGSYGAQVTERFLMDWHKPRIEICLEAAVDGLAIETIPSEMEAVALTKYVLENNAAIPFWVSFQCKSDKELAHGEDFAKAALSVWSIIKANNATSRFVGIGLNCVNPAYVATLFKTLLNAKPIEDNIPFVVYSNSGEVFDKETKQWTKSECCKPLRSFVPEWIHLGARVIGGCCRVYPQIVTELRKCVDEYNGGAK